MMQITNEQVIAAMQGNEQAFTDVYNAARNDVYRAARMIVKTDADAEDIVQEAFIKAYNSLDQLKDPSQFEAWIKQITRNKAIDMLRKKTALPFSSVGEEEYVPDEDIADTDAANIPEDAYEAKEREEMLHSLLEDLPAEQRIAVEMVYFEGKTYREAAAELGVNENTMKSRVFGAKKQITRKVTELEKKGVKLFSATPMGFFLWLLQGQTAATVPAVTTAMLTGAAAGSAALAGASGSTAVVGAVKAGLFAAHPILAKALVGVLAVALAGGIGTAIWSQNQKNRNIPAEEPSTIESVLETEENIEGLSSEEESISESASESETVTVTEALTEVETEIAEKAETIEETAEAHSEEAASETPAETVAPVTEDAVPTEPISSSVQETDVPQSSTATETTAVQTTEALTTAAPTTAAPTTAAPETTAPTTAPETTEAPTTEEVVETTPAGDPDYVYRNENFTFVVPEHWRGLVTVVDDGREKPGYNVYCGDYWLASVITILNGPGGYNTDGRGIADCIKINGQYAVDVTASNYGFDVDYPDYNCTGTHHTYEEMKTEAYQRVLFCQLGHSVNIDDYYNDHQEYREGITDAEMFPLAVQVEAFLPGILATSVHEPDWQP